MGLLDRALNFAQSAYNYVVGKDNASEPAKESVQKTGKASSTSKSFTNPHSSEIVNSVYNPSGATVGSVGDVVEKHNDDKNKVAKKHKTEKTVPMQHKVKINPKKVAKYGMDNSSIQNKIMQVKAKIIQKCDKFGIKYEEAEATILKQMNFSYKEFNETLSPEEQLGLLFSIDGALNLYIIDQGKRKIGPDADKAAVIGQTARNIIEAQEEGGINSIDEYKEGVGDINEELKSKVNEKTTDEEYIELLEESKKAFRASINLERIAAIKKSNGDKAKIAEINAKYEARLHAFEAQRQVDFAALYGPKKARLSLYLREAKDFSEAHAIPLSIYSGEARTVVADSFNHDFEMEAMRRFYQNGEQISAEEYEKAITYTTQFMSESALTKFEADAYEFRQKVERGEVKAPYMTKVVLEAESRAISTGISCNTNITEAKRAELLAKCNLHAQKTDGIRQNDNNKRDKASVQIPVDYIEQSMDYNIKKLYVHNPIAAAIIAEADSKKAQLQDIEKALTVMDYEVVRQLFSKNSDRDFAEVVLHNPKLKGHKHHIVSYIKSISADDLYTLTKGCSTEIFLFVLRNVAPDKAGRLYDLTKSEKCYAARKLGKKVIEEGRKNAA